MRGKTIIVIWQIAFTFIGTVIGAGFASGQEILRFFVIFGEDGIWGTILSGFMFIVIGYMIIEVVSKERITNYKEYLFFLFNERFLAFFDAMLAIFLLGGLTVMLIASGSLFSNIWSVPAWFGFYITGIIVYITLLMGDEGFLWLNTVLVPGIIILVIIVAGYTIVGSERIVITEYVEKHDVLFVNWLLSAVLYVAYNVVLGMVVLTSLGKKPAVANSIGIIIGGAFLGIMATFICKALLLQGADIIREELPMIILAYKISPLVRWIYSFVLWAAILTSAVANGFGLMKRLQSRLRWSRHLIVLIILIPCLPFVGWQLSSAVGTIYPLLGYSGLLFLVAIVYKSIATRIREWIN